MTDDTTKLGDTLVLQISPTHRIVDLGSGHDDHKARLWVGQSPEGTDVHVLVASVVPQTSDPAKQAEFAILDEIAATTTEGCRPQAFSAVSFNTIASLLPETLGPQEMGQVCLMILEQYGMPNEQAIDLLCNMITFLAVRIADERDAQRGPVH